MREIKFRAWDKRFKRMVYSGAMAILYLKDDDHEIMQFTGLHDKNGKEIWEGDIVTYEEWYRFHEECINSIDAVEFNISLAGWYPMASHINVEDGFYNHEIENIEVIGNIYETPELLK
jgi:uncharacterized phage protein (TIGR01671 family)